MSFRSALRINSNFIRKSRVFSSISVSTTGVEGTPSFSMFFENAEKKRVSPWHDIPLKSGDHFNFITEIPRYGRAKMEVSTKAAFNPIVQDMKKDKVRFYHGPIFWNYGCFPQTWEDPSHLHPQIPFYGDNDPLDVVEIGSSSLPCGSITPVKVLGVLAMIDGEELDWKVVAIRSDDPLAATLNDAEDLKKQFPEVVTGIREWFRWYKTPDDKPLNRFGFNEEFLSREAALEVIRDTHQYWSQLKSGQTKNAGNLWLA